MTESQKQFIRTMRSRGMTYESIARRLNLSFNTVKSFCRRDGILTPVPAKQPDSAHCKCCGRPLNNLPGNKPKTFCSDSCRIYWWNDHRKYHKNRYQLTCMGCGVTFISYGNRHRKYCGRACYARTHHGEGLP